MAILAMDSVTLAAVVDVDYIRRYYLLQASTLAAPAAPTTNPPSGLWSTTEPGYTAGSTNTLYTTDLIVFSDNSFDYLPVQKSSSYEAAKQAWNNAENAKDVATSAQASADSAIATASGKNTVTMSLVDAPASAAGTTPGDVWNRTETKVDAKDGTSKTTIIKAWVSDGTNWKPSLISETYISQINLGVGTYGLLKGDRLEADTITGREIKADLVGAAVGQFVQADIGNLVVTGTSTLSSAVVDRMFTNIFSAKKITGNEISAESIGAAVGSFVNISADQITGGLITASIGMWANGEIIAGQWSGTCAVMSAMKGFETKRVGRDGVQFVTTNIGNPNGANQFAIYKEDDSDATFSVSEDGDVIGQSFSSKSDIEIDGKPLLGKSLDPNAEDGWIDPLPKGIVAYGNFAAWAGDGRKATAPNSTAVTAGIGYLSFQMLAGRSYRVVMPYNYHVGSVVNSAGRAQVSIRYTYGTGGNKPSSVPNDSSTLVATDVHNHTAGVSWESGRLNFFWGTPFQVDTWVTLYIYLQAMNCVMTPGPGVSPVDSWKITVEDIGPLVADTADKFVSGTPPTAPKSNYVMTWTASASKNFLGNGNPSALSMDTSKNILRHGYYSGQAGDSRSVWVVNPSSVAGVGNDGTKTMAQALAGATITKVEIWVQSLHWWNSSGGTLYYRPLGSSTIPSTLTNAQSPPTVFTRKFTSRSQGLWITVPNSWVSATATGIVYGPTASSSQANYGYFADHTHPNVSYRPKFRISYNR